MFFNVAVYNTKMIQHAEKKKKETKTTAEKTKDNHDVFM